MANEEMKDMLGSLLEDLAAQQRDMATLQQRLAAVTASANSTDDLVTAWVNTQGIVISLKFHPDAVDRAGGLENLGRYIVEAVQQAAQNASAQVQEITAPMQARVDGMPQMSELFPGIPDAKDFLPEPVDPSLAPPDAPERDAASELPPEGEHYEEVEDLSPPQTGPVDRSW